ncbi:MAG: hypothetical protein H7Z19_07500 [Chitinophagaceae bacterium]|nr:hypothetical protein [Rubrivivax sp.]
MRSLLAFGAAMMSSVLLYLAVFAVVDRPLTLGEIPAAARIKADYARGLPSPKLAIWAGSNGRYSHRCSAFTATTGMACVNLSIAVGVGIDFQLLQIEPLLQRGDVVYVPLEYEHYRVGREEMESGAENTVLVHHRRDILWTLSPARIARAWGSFDLPFLIHGLIETGLDEFGFKRRSGITSLSPQGDETGHTAERGRPYREFIRLASIDPRPLPGSSHAIEVLAGFLDRARQGGIRVVGGLPTLPDHLHINPARDIQLQALFERHGHHFVVLPNRSQYPLDCFFDTVYHLNEGCQLTHSAAVGRLLARTMALR